MPRLSQFDVERLEKEGVFLVYYPDHGYEPVPISDMPECLQWYPPFCESKDTGGSMGR
jgi:hypothetical protein